MANITTEIVDRGPKRDTRGRRVTTAARREELLAAYDQSGATQQAFAKREGVNIHTFVSWLQKRRRTAAPGGPVRFAELPWTGSNAGLEVVLPGGILIRGHEATAVAQLVRSLSH